MSRWKCVLELNSDRSINSGTKEALHDSISRGADLKTYTEFRFNEHIDTDSKDSQLVEESTEFRVTYLVEDRWVAGIMNLRQPVSFYHGFGPRPSINSHDDDSNAPSQNFIYDFDIYRFMVKDDWEHIFTNDSKGVNSFGSIEDLSEASRAGCEFKVGITGLCNDLNSDLNDYMKHVVFNHLNSCYYHTEKKLMIGSTHPLIRVKPQTPMLYESNGWDFGWAVVRTDGIGFMRIVNPYSLEFRDVERQFEVQWYVR